MLLLRCHSAKHWCLCCHLVMLQPPRMAETAPPAPPAPPGPMLCPAARRQGCQHLQKNDIPYSQETPV